LLSLVAVPGAKAHAQRTTTPSYTVTDLGGLPGLSYEESEALAINDFGEIAGWSYTAGPNGSEHHAVVWAKDGTGNYVITDLGILGSARGINRSGEVVAGSLPGVLIVPITVNGEMVWYLDLDGDGVNDLETDLGDYIAPRAISDNAQIAAGPNVIQSDAFGNEIVATLPDGGFGWAINDFGGVAGSENGQATIWHVDAQGKVQDTYPLAVLPGYVLSTALCIDAQGRAAGYSSYKKANQLIQHATLWQSPNAPATDPGVLQKGGWSQAWGINTANNVVQVVGWASMASGSTGFLWMTGVMTDLNKLIAATGINLQGAYSVNSHGQIVGRANVTVGKNVEIHGFVLTPK